MKYHCGHNGCDVCGARGCADVLLEHIEDYLVCKRCVYQAVKLATYVAQTFSSIIDPARPCGYLERGINESN